MIIAHHLQKRFGATRAVDDVSFHVQRGEVLGFLGPNGAGKSTTMRLITGYLPPSAGRASIGGHDIATAPVAAKQLFGYLPENAPVYADMTVRGFLEFCAAARGLAGKPRDHAVQRVLETCFLEGVRHQPIDTLSKGYTHRTCFAQTLLHDPPVLILDEPTDGLDPNQKREIRALIRRMGETKAILLSTHILDEVETVCTRALILDRGRIVADGTPAELRRRAPDAGVVRLRLHGTDLIHAENALRELPAVAAILESHCDATGAVTLRLQPRSGRADGLAGHVAAALRHNGWPFDELHTEPGQLDELFREVTRHPAPPAPTTEPRP